MGFTLQKVAGMMVINIGLLKSGQYQRVLDDVKGVVEVAAIYEKLLPVYARAAQYQSKPGDMLAGLEL